MSTAVINGHLHFDNIGGNSLFPGVPIFVQQAEWDVAHAAATPTGQERVDFDVLDWVDFPGATYAVSTVSTKWSQAFDWSRRRATPRSPGRADRD